MQKKKGGKPRGEKRSRSNGGEKWEASRSRRDERDQRRGSRKSIPAIGGGTGGRGVGERG